MPYKLRKPCAMPGCPNLVNGRYCPEHLSQYRKLMDANRPNAHDRGYDYEWQQYAGKYLKDHPYCVDPEKRHAGTRVLATVVDHIKPHKGNEALFWDVSNHQSLCTSCHNHKTAVHDSKFASH